MNLSLNFVKDYIDLDNELSVKDIAEAMTKAGNEYDSAEKLVNATKLVIGEIKECEMHPDSDHLHLCKVDIGSEVLDIVCGAPNARKGIKVIVAQVGAELPGDFKIKKGMIRGQESNGMFYNCSKLTTTINIMNANVTNYEYMFYNAATDPNAKITVNYIAAASTLVDNMIATKSSSSNVVKGTQI